MRVDEIKVFCGTAVPGLSKEICAFLDVPLGDAIVSQFNDGEIKVQLNENVRGNDVFLINSTAPPVNHNLMELLILIDAARRASARRITAVIPYYGYARQDKKDKPRVPLTAKLVANLITAAGADRVLTLDLHAGQIQAQLLSINRIRIRPGESRLQFFNEISVIRGKKAISLTSLNISLLRLTVKNSFAFVRSLTDGAENCMVISLLNPASILREYLSPAI